MPIPFVCPHCDRDYHLADDMAGRTLRCQSCKETFKVRGIPVADKRFNEEEDRPSRPRARSSRHTEEDRRSPDSRYSREDDYEDRPRENRRPRRRREVSEGVPASEVLGWIFIAFLTLLGLGVSILLFCLVPGTRGGVLGTACLLSTVYLLWALLIAKGNAETSHVVLGTFIPFYWFIFAYRNFDRYGGPYLISVLAAALFTAARFVPSELATANPPSGPVVNAPPAPQQLPPNPPPGQPRMDPQPQPPVVPPPQLVIPGPPFPDTLASSTTDITLSGRLTDVAVGGGGRYLVLYLESQNKLALFDVKEKKVTTELPAPNGKFHFAANATQLVTIASTSNTLDIWNLATGKKESSSALPEVLANKEIHQICMGSASQRLLFLYLPGEKLTVILDLPTLRLGAVEWARWGPRNAYGPLTMRASPDGSLLVGWGGGWAGTAVAGFQDGRQVSLWENTEGGEHLFALPSTNNKYIFTELGMVTSDFRTKKLKDFKNSYLVPAHEPGLFLSLHYLPGPGIQRDPGGRILFQPIKKVVLRTEDGLALFGLDDKEWDMASDLPWEKIIHYYHSTRLMITFPDRNKVRLRQF